MTHNSGSSNKRAWFMALTIAFITGCSAISPSGRPGDESPDPVERGETNDKGRAELWAQKCSQCHYARGPDTFSQDQWGIIMFHMRVRANLTAEEHDTILDFLKSAN